MDHLSICCPCCGISCIFSFQILNEIAQHKIQIYEFPECDGDEDEMRLQKKLKVSVNKCSMEFATFLLTKSVVAKVVNLNPHHKSSEVVVSSKA